MERVVRQQCLRRIVSFDLRNTQRREWWRVLSLLFAALFLSKSVHCSIFDCCWKEAVQSVHPKPSTQNQRRRESVNRKLNKNPDPPNSALLTDFLIKNVLLMNESVFPLSVSVTHPPTSTPKQPVCPRHISKNLRHHRQRRARCLRLKRQTI